MARPAVLMAAVLTAAVSGAGVLGSSCRAFLGEDPPHCLDGDRQPGRAVPGLVVNLVEGLVELEDSNQRSDSYFANLVGARVSYDLTKRWDIGLNTSALFSADGRSVQYGIGPEVGFHIKYGLRVAVGYNHTSV